MITIEIIKLRQPGKHDLPSYHLITSSASILHWQVVFNFSGRLLNSNIEVIPSVKKQSTNYRWVHKTSINYKYFVIFAQTKNIWFKTFKAVLIVSI